MSLSKNLIQENDALKAAIIELADAVNAHGDTEIARLQDVSMRVHEIALHGVHHGAADALACTESHVGADLVDVLSPNFVEERTMGTSRASETTSPR